MGPLRRSLILLATLGCADSAPLTAPSTNPTVSVTGPLTFSVTDFPAMGGVLWIAPTASGARGVITATSIRYGSLCTTAVSGRLDETGTRVTLHVSFTERSGVVCTKDVRAIRYDAVIAGLAPGRYEVHLLHAENGAPELEARVQQVDVT